MAGGGGLAQQVAEKLADLIKVGFEATAILSLQGDESFLEAIIDVLILKSRL